MFYRHFPENVWREWPEIWHADVSRPHPGLKRATDNHTIYSVCAAPFYFPRPQYKCRKPRQPQQPKRPVERTRTPRRSSSTRPGRTETGRWVFKQLLMTRSSVNSPKGMAVRALAVTCSRHFPENVWRECPQIWHADVSGPHPGLKRATDNHTIYSVCAALFISPGTSTSAGSPGRPSSPSGPWRGRGPPRRSSSTRPGRTETGRWVFKQLLMTRSMVNSPKGMAVLALAVTFSGHFPQNVWREWPQIWHADVSGPHPGLKRATDNHTIYSVCAALFISPGTSTSAGSLGSPGRPSSPRGPWRGRGPTPPPRRSSSTRPGRTETGRWVFKQLLMNRSSVNSPKGMAVRALAVTFSGHFPENVWREWPQIWHADVSGPHPGLKRATDNHTIYSVCAALFISPGTSTSAGSLGSPGRPSSPRGPWRGRGPPAEQHHQARQDRDRTVSVQAAAHDPILG